MSIAFNALDKFLYGLNCSNRKSPRKKDFTYDSSQLDLDSIGVLKSKGLILYFSKSMFTFYSC